MRIKMDFIRGKGFSLLEVLLVISAFGLIMAAMTPVFRTSVEAWQDRDSQIEMIQSGRVSIEEMEHSIKNATSFSQALASSVMFEDSNGAQNGFRLNGNVLQELRPGENWEELSSPVSGFTLTYFDEANNETTVSGDVQLIKINLVMSDPNGNIAPEMFNASVMMRKDTGF